MNIEIERLRAEGHRFMKEQEDRVNKEKELVMMAVYKQQSDRPQGLEATLTVKWSKKIRNYTEQEIRLLFESLGVCQVVFSRKETNRGSAIIEFDSILNASNIIDAKLKFDTQFTDFTITWTAGSAPMILDQLKRNQRQEMNELSNMVSFIISASYSFIC